MKFETEKTWNHTVCEVCWFAKHPQRFPVQVIRHERQYVDSCCLCGSPKVTRIFVRIDPVADELLCSGRHVVEKAVAR